MTDNTEQNNDKTPEPQDVAGYQQLVQHLRDELKTVRGEAAERRVKLNEVRGELAKAKSAEEFQSLSEKYEKLEKKIQHDSLINRHAARLPEDLRQSTAWPEDEDGIKSLAQKLSVYAVTDDGTGNPGGGLGPRGNDDTEEYDPKALAASLKR